MSEAAPHKPILGTPVPPLELVAKNDEQDPTKDPFLIPRSLSDAELFELMEDLRNALVDQQYLRKTLDKSGISNYDDRTEALLAYSVGSYETVLEPFMAIPDIRDYSAIAKNLWQPFAVMDARKGSRLKLDLDDLREDTAMFNELSPLAIVTKISKVFPYHDEPKAAESAIRYALTDIK